jgi:enterochelin esterase-like enzyme
MYKPEYGIVPHCKIGGKITRAQFFSTVRIVCLTPPGTVLYENLPIFVSLNGFDFVDTGF